jgi:SAM-dependent methyltransferase
METPHTRPPEALLREYLRSAPLSRAVIRSRELELLLEAESPRGRVIDLGHGDGLFASILIKNGFPIHVAMDRSLDELRRAKSMTDIHLVVGDMEHPPFRPGVFDAAVSNCVLEHVVDLDRVMSETARMLSSRGRAYLTVVAEPYENLLFWPAFLRGLGLKGPAQWYLDFLREKFVHRRYITTREWLSSASNAGFDPIRTIPYAARRRMCVMDLFLPFVQLSRFLRDTIGRETLIPNRWPAGLLHKFLREDGLSEVNAGNAFLFLEKKS